MTTLNKARLAASLALALSVSFAGVARADDQAVKIAKKEKVGSYLADSKGMALYVFKKDSKGKSACSGPCIEKWPVFYREKVGATGKLKAASFGTITREDGEKQTTYKGKPLYYFADDKSPADTSGDGFKDVWSLAKP